MDDKNREEWLARQDAMIAAMPDRIDVHDPLRAVLSAVAEALVAHAQELRDAARDEEQLLGYGLDYANGDYADDDDDLGLDDQARAESFMAVGGIHAASSLLDAQAERLRRIASDLPEGLVPNPNLPGVARDSEEG
jgi:hypothetical protein